MEGNSISSVYDTLVIFCTAERSGQSSVNNGECIFSAGEIHGKSGVCFRCLPGEWHRKLPAVYPYGYSSGEFSDYQLSDRNGSKEKYR